MPKPNFSAKLTDLNPSELRNVPASVRTESPGQKRGPSAGNDFYKAIRPFLIFGRIIGIVPLEGLGQKNHQLLTFKRTSVKSIISLLIIICLVFCVGVSLICLVMLGNKTVTELVWATNPVIFFSMGLFGYSYMYWRNEVFRALLRKWHNSPLSVYTEDTSLKRDANLIFGIIFSSCILENLLQQAIKLSLFDWLQIKMNGTKTELNPLQAYYNTTTQPNWSIIIPYNPVFSVVGFIWNKCALYSWNFVDIFVILFARAMYFQFRAITSHTEQHVINRAAATDGSIYSSSEMLTDYDKWQSVSRDFETLCSVLDDAKRFLSPMVFSSYAVNLFFVIIHLHMGLTPTEEFKNSAATELYRTWSFLHILCRLYLLSLFASRIHESAEEFVELYRQCPSDCYSMK
ncbi:unnamed protein product, partial [Allacma fusca]